MSKDNAAYAAVKALKAIVQNVETKDEAQQALDAIRTGDSITQIMQNIAGYKELKE